MQDETMEEERVEKKKWRKSLQFVTLYVSPWQ